MQNQAEQIAELIEKFPEIAEPLSELLNDLHRLYIVNHLPEAEERSILMRILRNERAFSDFVRNGPKQDQEAVNK